MVSQNAGQHDGDDEESVALSAKGKKKSNKKGSNDGNKQKCKGKKNMSKVKYFVCHKMGYYARKYPNKKKNRVLSRDTCPIQKLNPQKPCLCEGTIPI